MASTRNAWLAPWNHDGVSEQLSFYPFGNSGITFASPDLNLDHNDYFLLGEGKRCNPDGSCRETLHNGQARHAVAHMRQSTDTLIWWGDPDDPPPGITVYTRVPRIYRVALVDPYRQGEDPWNYSVGCDGKGFLSIVASWYNLTCTAPGLTFPQAEMRRGVLHPYQLAEGGVLRPRDPRVIKYVCPVCSQMMPCPSGHVQAMEGLPVYGV